MEEVKVRDGPKHFRFVGINALVIDSRDKSFRDNEKYFLTSKTYEGAINQYLYLLKKKYGFNKIIRDIKIVPLKINN